MTSLCIRKESTFSFKISCSRYSRKIWIKINVIYLRIHTPDAYMDYLSFLCDRNLRSWCIYISAFCKLRNNSNRCQFYRRYSSYYAAVNYHHTRLILKNSYTRRLYGLPITSIVNGRKVKGLKNIWEHKKRTISSGIDTVCSIYEGCSFRLIASNG
jgi:hypothetical protein